MGDGTENVTAGEVLATVERERSAWEDLLAEVGEARILEPGAMGAWTFKDLVTHLTGWWQRDLARLEAAANGQPDPAPPWPAELDDDDQINEWIQAQSADLPLAEAVEQSRQTFVRLAAAVGGMSEAYLNDAASVPWAEGVALGPAIVSGLWFGHLHDDHVPEIRAWLAAPS